MPKSQKRKTEKRHRVKLRHLRTAVYLGGLEEAHAHLGPGKCMLSKDLKKFACQPN